MHLIWPTDGTPVARRALPFISLLCRSAFDRVTVTSVDEPRYMDVTRSLMGARPAPDGRTENALHLAEQMQAVEGLPGRLEGVPLAGLAGAEIVGLAERLRPDLIVMGDGQHAARRMLLGSTSRFVARHAPSSVLVVRHERVPRSILVADDGSADVRAALPLLHRLGPPGATRVRVVRVVREAPRGRGLGGLADATSHDARLVLAALREDYRDAGLSGVTSVVLRGNPWARLRVEIAKTQPDLIVVGAAGARAIRMVPGGVSDRILRKTHASVLIARQHRPAAGG
ncbi:MAG: universal stress protein [Dehalococcoidia bacterium]|nr:universal stress protein [Dehalococcoidia bacterium]